MKLITNVPLELSANLAYRRDLLRAAHKDKGVQRAIKEQCKHDILYFLSSFCWCFEPRKRYYKGRELPNKVPFIVWEHQAPVITDIFNALGERDIIVEKSRGEGASWIGVLLAVHNFLLVDHSTIGIVSKDERSADDADNPDSLGWKFDRELEWLPNWMGTVSKEHFKRDLSNHAWTHHLTGSAINAYAATSNVASGGRRSWFLMDELGKFPKPQDRAAMASTQPVTDCRLVMSTPWGASGAYYDMVHEQNNALKLTLSWEKNPTRNRGLYTMLNGVAIAEDPVNNPLPPEYDPPNIEVLSMFSRLRTKGFILERRLRSPWYDRECDRPQASTKLIAQEYDRNYGGSSHRVFGEEIIEVVSESVLPPAAQGDIDFTVEKLKDVAFSTKKNGPLKIWFPIDFTGNPPVGSYTLGCDVSNGLGGTMTSNSTIIGFDNRNNEQILEFASRTMPPQEFADYCIALSKWLGGAFLCWEANGPGMAYSARVKKRGYGKVMKRKVKSHSGNRDGMDLGWWTSEDSKRVMFGDIFTMIRNRELTIRSADLKAELQSYIYKDGKIYHALSAEANDDSRGISHGDRVIGACVANQGLKKATSTDPEHEDVLDRAPPNTLAWRNATYLESRRQDTIVW